MLDALSVGAPHRALLSALLTGFRQLDARLAATELSNSSTDGTSIRPFFTPLQFLKESKEGADPGSKDSKDNLSDAERARLKLPTDIKVTLDSTGYPASASIVRLVEATLSHLKRPTAVLKAAVGHHLCIHWMA